MASARQESGAFQEEVTTSMELSVRQVLGQKKGQIFSIEPGIILFLKKSFLLIS